jgi:hypothetical protein
MPSRLSDDDYLRDDARRLNTWTQDVALERG